MTPDHSQALTSIALFAAFADGSQSDSEREKLKEVVSGLGMPGGTEAFRRVLLKETTVADEAALLDSEELRLLAWEGALGVCESDGATSAAERRFLDDLAIALKRPLDVARRDVADADAMTVFATADGPPPLLPTLASAPGAPATDARATDVDASIVRYSILTAAIELLPQNLATLAIIPLQTKMVHSIGTTYGYALSPASIKEFIATIGVGMTGQMVEQFARSVLKALGGGLLGGIGKGAAAWGTGPALTFATTYAIGMVAKQYYAGGRTLAAIDLKSVFHRELDRAKGLYARYEPQVRDTAVNTNAASLLRSLRS